MILAGSPDWSVVKYVGVNVMVSGRPIPSLGRIVRVAGTLGKSVIDSEGTMFVIDTFIEAVVVSGNCD